MAFKKALIERALGAELTHHLCCAAGTDKPLHAKNHRNGASGKTVLTDDGARDPGLSGRAVWHRGVAGLEPMYPVVSVAALRVKIREDAVVRNRAIYLALRVLPDGMRDILGLWIENAEGAKLWMKVFHDLKTRGVNDSLDYAPWKDRKARAAAIKPVYTAPSAEGALAELDAFENVPWGKKFPTVAAAW